MTVKKSVHPRTLPGLHPGLEQRLREAEQAEAKGETPRSLEGPQKILRPTIDVSSTERQAQVRTIGLVDPAYRKTQDGLAALAQQDAFRPGADLDQIWDSLSEAEKLRAGAVERFRLEMESSLKLSAMPWNAPHKLGGRLDARGLKRLNDNVRAEIDAYGYLLAPDSYRLLIRFVDDTHKLFDLCLRVRAVQGIDTVSAAALVQDLVEKLIYQELCSRRRAMGDRGIRRICGNIELAEQLYNQAKRLPDFTPRERLLMRVIHVHQDLGQTAYAARVSFRGSKLHRAYGARIFNDEINRYRGLFTHEELEQARTAVATHSSEELPFTKARVLAFVRAVDHLAPFAPFRLLKQLEPVANAGDYLDDLAARARQGETERYVAAKDALRTLLEGEQMHPGLRDDLLAAFRPLHKNAELIELGPWGGEISGLQLDANGDGAVVAKITPDPFTVQHQALFDYQQQQLLNVARACEISPEAFREAPQVVLTRPGFGALVLVR
ncbi:MAG: hypothetical protein HY903_07175 [Deltaproteobacteria bacterium]|nr:hypothetical protein [Deltaproteobacteria bacterium]